MGKEDMEMKCYFSDRRRYADLWNGCMFAGEQILHPEELQTAETAVHGGKKGMHTERTSDLVMKQVAGRQILALWILENQKNVDYSMPARVMLRESLEYNRQILDIKRKNGEEYRKMQKAERTVGDTPYYENEGEFLYRFRAGDKIFPVVTLVVYWGDEAWDGPRTLHDMMNWDMECGSHTFQEEQHQSNRQEGKPDGNLQESLCGELDRRLRRLIPEYPLHIVNLADIEDYSLFRTELRLLFELYSCRGNKEELKRYMESHEECRHMDEETCHMLGVMTHFKQLQNLEEKESGEGIDVCKAIVDMINDGKMEGKAEGKAEGELRMVRLTRILLDQNKMSDLTRALEDTEFRNDLFFQYHLV